MIMFQTHKFFDQQYLKKKNEHELDFRSEKVGNKLIDTYGIKPKKRHIVRKIIDHYK